MTTRVHATSAGADTTPRGVPTAQDLLSLARLTERFAPYHGSHPLRLPGTFAVRGNTTSSQLVHGVYRPSVCIVAQGAKRVFLGPEVFDYDERKMLMFSVELPVASEIVRASPGMPFLCVKIEFEPQRVAELSRRVFTHGLPDVRENRGVGVGDATGEIVNAATRLLSLMGDARDAELLAPLVMDEILIRLLRGPLGPRLAQIGREDTGAQRVTKAVDWVRAHFDRPMAVETLAELVHMSPSAFHGHFKAVTNMSPLQFQKALRLREARRLMLTANMDVAGAGRQVGYVSASQFIREYRRLFGNAPARDVALLRQQGETQADLN
ncbi:AraC family transcriptional regulator [Deinococcus aquiradiocola]|uniref:AraC family transcriptional regulator n=1 Tax=Deinococcus aquiradiocola TaxID=393059 RepID=A0A917PHB9_9DEIO|nr:AraC family transcriptional regulator [Deinococcus aquiradiocola]GGJ77822.1 AraC family transcriptional regulator [Deinococcus aquiradiocola]